MSLADMVAARGISELLHFTTNRGALGILASKAIKARARLATDTRLEKIFYPNAADRSRDSAWHDYVNLSVSSINENFFSICSKHWHRDQDFWWAVFSMRPEVMFDDGVYFTTTNNMYSGVRRERGEIGFNALFDSKVVRWTGNIVARSSDMPNSFPTCNQAEVLYPGEISTEFLQRVYVLNEEYADELAGQISVAGHDAIEIVVSPELFGGVR